MNHQTTSLKNVLYILCWAWPSPLSLLDTRNKAFGGKRWWGDSNSLTLPQVPQEEMGKCPWLKLVPESLLAQLSQNDSAASGPHSPGSQAGQTRAGLKTSLNCCRANYTVQNEAISQESGAAVLCNASPFCSGQSTSREKQLIYSIEKKARVLHGRIHQSSLEKKTTKKLWNKRKNPSCT